MTHSSTIFRLCFLLQLVTTTLLLSASAAKRERCHPEDKKALLQIKKDLNYPTALSSWKPTTDCCHNWQGVACEKAKNYRVSSLIFFDVDIRPHPIPIPPSVADLPYLNLLYFVNVPNLTGPIPRSVAKLANLQSFQISNTSLSGTIPDFLSRIDGLSLLELSTNNLSGPIPPSLSRLPNLRTLTLDFNSLSGSIPDSFGSFSKNLISLSLSHNQLSGQIPKSLGKLNLSSVNLSNNKLEGDASMLFGSHKNTNSMDLSRNKLAFDLEKVGISYDLIMLDLSFNQIYGKIPQGITLPSDLRYFNVSYNNLCGKIPSGWRSITQFDASSYLHNKCLCGSPLPSCRRSF